MAASSNDVEWLLLFATMTGRRRTVVLRAARNRADLPAPPARMVDRREPSLKAAWLPSSAIEAVPTSVTTESSTIDPDRSDVCTNCCRRKI